jgi:Fur family transcriptional regulator, ferric uptake regulator
MLNKTKLNINKKSNTNDKDCDKPNSVNFKLTNQRQVIMDYFKDNYIHPTVDDVYENVKIKLPRISKKTVYLNLQFLAEKGLIKEMKIKGVQRYEPQLKPHHHLICKICGCVLDLESEKLTKLTKNIAKEIDNFYVENIDTNFYGICNKCKGGK